METPQGSWDRLFPYQKDGVGKLVRILTNPEGHRGALLADPVGAGKSPMTIFTFSTFQCRRVLIVCPKSLRLNWAREVERWTGGSYATHVLKGSQDEVPSRSEDGRPLVVIVNYHLTCRSPLLERLQAEPWDFLAFDEAHALKAPTAHVSRVCAVLLWSRAKYRLPITGTPVPNGRAAEAYILFSRLAPDLFGDWQAYRDRYCVAEETKWGIKYPRSKNLEELGRLARERFMVRRPKEEVLKALPGLVRQTVPLDIPRLQVREAQGGEHVDVDAMVALVVKSLDAGMPLTSDPISTARRKLGILKVGPALEFIEELLEEVESVVVFCHHREVFFGLKEGLAAREIGVASISGMTPATERQMAVDMFQAPNGPRVFLASIAAASTGITLTRSHTVVFVESSWTSTDNEQAEARVYRQTQREICRAIYLVVPDSLDEKMQGVVTRKRRDIAKVLAA